MVDRVEPPGESPIAQEILQYYPRIRRVDEYVREHLSEPLTLVVVAEVSCLEPKYFSAYFRQKTGILFNRWLAMLRVNQACSLLRGQDRSIREVATAVGFKDIRTFERTFKRLRGMTPREFQALVRPGCTTRAGTRLQTRVRRSDADTGQVKRRAE